MTYATKPQATQALDSAYAGLAQAEGALIRLAAMLDADKVMQLEGMVPELREMKRRLLDLEI